MNNKKDKDANSALTDCQHLVRDIKKLITMSMNQYFGA